MKYTAPTANSFHKSRIFNSLITFVAAAAAALLILASAAPQASAQTTCPPLTQGFWKNHFPSAWKNGTGLTLGTTFYTNAQLLGILQTPVGGDASLILAHQLIAALLSIANGTDPGPVSATISHANTLLGAGPIPEHVRPSSTLGQQMVSDGAILDNYNNGAVTQACAAVVPPGSCQPSSSLSVLVTGTNVVSYIPKGNWSITPAANVAVVNVEGSSIVPQQIPTPNVINSCASNSATGKTVCTANNNQVYVISGTAVTSTLTSAGSGFLGFSGGSCTNCGVAMDGIHNKAVIALSLGGVGGFQYLDLGSLTFEPAFASQSPGAQISEDILIDPTRNLLLSPGEFNNYEIVNVNTTTSPTFFQNGVVTGGVGELDSAGCDCATGIILAPAEFSGPSRVFISDVTQATFTPGSPGTWSAPSQVQSLSESFLSAGASGLAVAQGTHTGAVTGEFGGDAITAIALPTTSGVGSGIPAISDWVTCRIPSFSMGFDPHTLTAYKSPSSGDAIALVANGGATSLAVVDLKKMLDPLIVPRTVGGHGCASGTLPASVVSFIAVP